MEKTTIGYICENSEDLREILDDQAPLDAVLRQLQTGDADPDRMRNLLVDLHIAVQQAGDALGVYGGAGRGVFTPAGSGLGPARRTEVMFHCPRARCSRMVQPDPAATVSPRCALFDEDLPWVTWVAP